MNIRQYLSMKYSMKTPTTMTKVEARIFGIPYPLRHGWLIAHGQRGITASMADALRTLMEQRAENKTKENLKEIAASGVIAAHEAKQQALHHHP